MKRGLFVFSVFFVLIGVFSVVDVIAQSCGKADDNQLIMRISSETNAHGEVWNGGSGYGTEICFNQIFGSDYPIAGAHSCTGSNLVLNLSANTNAHAESPPGVNYGIGVCFGDLVCVEETSGCTFGRTEVVRLSASTNAHLESSSGTGAYSVSICCTSGSGGGVDYRWEDFAGNEINESYVNRTVRLVAQTGLGSGETVDFEIYESDPVGDDDIRTGANKISAVTDSSGVAVGVWKITDADMDAGDDAGTEQDPWEFYFKATIVSSSASFLSTDYADSVHDGVLHTHNYEGFDSDPTAVITGELAHRGAYFVDNDINFDHASFDIEGPIDSVLWTVENSSGVEFTDNRGSFDYTFTTGGERIITLWVNDSAGHTDETQIAIVIIASPGMIAFVNDPFHMEIVMDADLDGNGYPDHVVNFDASDSYVINTTWGGTCATTTIECIAGTCPINSSNPPIIGVECPFNVSIVGGGSPGLPFTPLMFDWQFDDGDDFSDYGSYSGQKIYGVGSNALNDKLIKLSLTYSEDVVPLTEVSNRIFTLGQCIDDGKVFVEDSSGSLISYDTFTSSACSGVDGLIGTSDDCCFAGHECTSTGCEATDITQCADYVNPADCNNDTSSVLEIDPLYTYDPSCELANVSCACSWVGGECGLEKSVSNLTILTGGVGQCEHYTCTYFPVEGTCNDGVMDVTTTVDFSAGDCDPGILAEDVGCVPETIRNVPCGQFSIELSFFEGIQFAYALIFIFLIYFVVHCRENVKKWV